MQEEELKRLFSKWVGILRIDNNWDIRLELVRDSSFKKTGDIKIDIEDKKAIVYINILDQ